MPNIKAIANQKKLEVAYIDNQDRVILRKDGSHAWRNTNPGNLSWIEGGFASKHGAIGYDSSFAIFPDYQTGWDALNSLWHLKKYYDFPISQGVSGHAPEKGGNNVEQYRKLVKQFTGLDIERKVSSLSREEYLSLMQAIQRVEGWKEGQEFHPKRIVATKCMDKKKKSITHYQIEGSSAWIPKAEAIGMVERNEIYAVVVYAGKGAPYLKAHPDKEASNNLNSLKT